jgi:hypothetical protein
MKTRNQRGYILLLVLVSGAGFMIAISSIVTLSFSTYRAARHNYAALSSLAVAEAGGDAAVAALNFASNSGNSYNGTTAPSGGNCALATSSTSSANAVTFFNDNVRGKGTYETCIVDTTVINNSSVPSQNRYEKVVYSVGKIYLPASSSHPISVTRIKLVLIGSPSGNYSVQTGPGGLVLANSATVGNGNVYVGGGITMTNTSQIGTSTTPSTVYAANYLCPLTSPYTGYPQLCSSSQPISIGNQAHIYGSVYANGQTDGSNMSNAGLVQTSGVANVTMPDYDRAGQKSRVTTQITGDQACGNGNNAVTYQANTKLNGNLTLNNNCILTLKGDVWITGHLNMTQKAIIQADASVTNPIHIMVDGQNGVSINNQAGIATNANGVGFDFITYYSTASCGADCSSVTGADLVNSTGVTTISLNQQSLSTGTTFYARWTALSVSQSGNIGAILAQKIYLNNSGVITFGKTDSALGTYAWGVKYYEQLPVRDLGTTN